MTASLPAWSAALVVVAHPDDESFGLGAVIDAFVKAGTVVDVLCFTRGEASTLGAAADLAQTRADELHEAALTLGARSTQLRDHPDGRLGRIGPQILAQDVAAVAERCGAQGLLVFDPSGITGHPDHTAATAAAIHAATEIDLPVLAWTLPLRLTHQLSAETGIPLIGHPPADIDLVIEVDRAGQYRAIACHASQAVPGSVLWRRLDLLGDREYLRWLCPPRETPLAAPPPDESETQTP